MGDKMGKDQVGENEKKFSREMSSDFPGSGKTARLVFKKNRSHDLHVGGSVYHFDPHEEKEVPASVLSHEDFKNQAADFITKE